MTKTIFAALATISWLITIDPVLAQQPTKNPRIGYLTLNAKPTPLEAAFEDELSKLGWAKGQNLTIEYRRGNRDNIAGLAKELVAMKVDILAARATPAVAAAKNATQTIPIVMVSSADAVGSGFVADGRGSFRARGAWGG